MEASTVAPTQVSEPEQSHDGAAEATRSTEELFQWSGFVHVGGGAESCEHGADGACTDPKHFHAWVTLPNSFQIRDITDKARAARARKARALRDPESDAYAVLEAEIDDLFTFQHEALLDSLARAEVDKHIRTIVSGLEDDDRFEFHAQDAEEYNRLLTVPEEERDKEEFDRLEQDMAVYAEELQKEIDAAHARELEKLKALPDDQVRELERRSRIDAISTETYLFTYYTWAMYVGAREPATDGFPSRRKFKSPDDFKLAPPEVVNALREKIRELEGRMSRGDTAGN